MSDALDRKVQRDGRTFRLRPRKLQRVAVRIPGGCAVQRHDFAALDRLARSGVGDRCRGPCGRMNGGVAGEQSPGESNERKAYQFHGVTSCKR